MTTKSLIGRLCEYTTKTIIQQKTGCIVTNSNDVKVNHPVTDLVATHPRTGKSFYVSVKAKTGREWPSVKGICRSDQYLVFVSLDDKHDPMFYVLTNRQWGAALRRMLPQRDPNAIIVAGAIEWNWQVGDRPKKRRGSLVRVEDIERYKDNWAVLPSANATA